MRSFLTAVGLFFLTAGSALAQSASPVVDHIVINGVMRIEPETVLTYLMIRKGDTATPERLDAGLKSLFSTGLFADVGLKMKNGVLTVDLVENPIVNVIAFEGNKKIKDDQLRDEISLKPRMVFTRSKAQSDTQRIVGLYKRIGRYSAQIEPKIIKRSQNRLDVVFEIDEGKPTYIRRIRSGETDLHKISLVNQFSREFTTTDLSVEAGMQRLDEIEREKRYHFWIRVLAAATVAACFAVMFGGNGIDFCCAFITGSISYTLSRFLEKYEINFFIRGLCCCAVAAFIALLIAASLPQAAYQPIISGTIMLFVPGVAITNSIRDFLSGDMLAGLTRMVEAFLTAVSLAAGAGLVLKLWVMIGGISL